MRDLTSKLFGKATYFFSVCEFQKRGLPHAHIVIKFDGASPEARHEVEKWIWRNLPDKRIDGGKPREKSSSIWCTKSVVISIRTHRA